MAHSCDVTQAKHTAVTTVTKKTSPKGLVLAHINICSLRNKVQELYLFLQINKVDILAVSETHLDCTFDDSEVSIEGFSIYRKDRNGFGGGVAIFIREHFPVKQRHDLMVDGIEAIWLQVQLPHLKPILVGCCYRAPNSNIQYLNDLCTMMDTTTEENRELYLLGDLNIDWLSDTCSLKNKLWTSSSTCGLSQLMCQPTRISVNQTGVKSSKCIDHIYTNNSDLCSTPVSVPLGFSDHNFIAVTRRTKLPKASAKIVQTRSYKKFTKESFLREIDNIQWSDVCNVDDAELALKIFMNYFMNVVNRHAPLKKYTVKAKSAPWLDVTLKNLMVLRDEAKKTAVLSGSHDDMENYRKLRNEVTKTNRAKKKSHYRQKISESGNDGNKLWKVFNEIMGRSRTVHTSFIEVDGVYLTKPYSISNYFNTFFVDKVSTLRRNMDTVVTSKSVELIKSNIMKDKNCDFDFHQVQVESVEKLLSALPVDKSAGTDHLDGKLLKIAAAYISKPVCHIFNRSLISGVWPKNWKEGKILPLPKGKSKIFNGPNCRPISILPVLSKVLEKIVSEQIQEYFNINGLTTMFQHAYRASHSTSTAMLQMTDSWLAAMDSSMLVGTVMLDFSAAFEVIDHDLLIEKLACYGLKLSAITWLRSYLSSRSQRVYFNGTLSDSKQLDCGVPQGSCLGPLLYSIFTNDLPYAIEQASLTMYADDSTIYYAALTCSELNQVLSSELNIIHNWIIANKLVLNTSKTVCMMFGSNHKLAQDPKLNLLIDSQPILQVKKTKLLGLCLDSALSWSDHITKIVSRMGGALAVTRKCAPFLKRSMLNQIVRSLVLCHLDYCSGVWSSASKGLIRKLQVAQNKAARLVLGCSSRSNVTRMHESLQWLNVESRLLANVLIFFHKVNQTQTPTFIFQNITYRSDLHPHSTRAASSRQMILPRPRTNSLKKTFLNRAIGFWNCLPNHLRLITCIASFKKKIKSYLRNRINN